MPDRDAEWAALLDDADRLVVRAERERDAARAEVAALREEVAHAWAVANGEARR